MTEERAPFHALQDDHPEAYALVVVYVPSALHALTAIPRSEREIALALLVGALRGALEQHLERDGVDVQRFVDIARDHHYRISARAHPAGEG